MRKDALLKERARQLRHNAAPAEVIVWKVLRGRRFAGLKFRRQHPIGPYIVDFFCAHLKVIVELDGETHLGREKNDAARQTWLENQGYKVVRFWNPLVYEDREALENTIWRECEERMGLLVPLYPGGKGLGVRGLRLGKEGKEIGDDCE
jgi:very-short-patch-repair endonuclease